MTAVTTFPSDLSTAIKEAINGKPGVLGFMKNFKKTMDGANATRAGLATKMYAAHKAYAASDTESLDLAGALVGIDGAACVFTKVHAIYVKAKAGNANPVQVGGAASNTFVGPFADASDIIKVNEGETWLITNDAGWAVTAGTGDLLKLANGSGAAIEFDIVIMGE